jgi:hypothetical protein
MSPSFTSPSSAAKAATVCVRSLLCTASVWSTAAQKPGLRSLRPMDASGTYASCTLRTTAEGGGWPVTARYSTAPSAYMSVHAPCSSVLSSAYCSMGE